MQINTKYSTGDKVWFYIKEFNQYTWGKVVSLDIIVRCGKEETTYNVENRFYDDQSWRDYIPMYYSRPFKSDQYISLRENQVFETPEAVRTDLEQKHFEKMSELKELKKGWFNS